MAADEQTLAAPPLDEPLSDEELDTLAEDIEAAGGDFDWTTGFLTAVLTGPDFMPPSQWMTDIFDDDAFVDAEDAKHQVGRLMRWYNEILFGLREPEHMVFPALDDVEAVQAFCTGYVAGARKHPGWRADEIAVARLFPLGVLGGLFPVTELRDELDRPIDDVDARLRKWREALPVSLRDFYAYWARYRGTHRKRSAKVGRNDACPCGSGKKFKKCCQQ